MWNENNDCNIWLLLHCKIFSIILSLLMSFVSVPILLRVDSLKGVTEMTQLLQRQLMCVCARVC
jgi:hypothetical protein